MSAPAASSASARTFVLSDAHGYPNVIEEALEHGGFRPGHDALVYAGDLLDRGPDPEGCIDLVRRYATTVLVGNHELAVLLDFDMWGTDPESRRFRPLLIDLVAGATPDSLPARPGAPCPSVRWQAAACIQGVLITHAGVSARYGGKLDWEGTADPVQLVARINEEFQAAVQLELETGDWDEDGILGRSGPLWFRPYGTQLPLPGMRQVVGHTPPQPQLEGSGFYMVDPCVWMKDGPARLRYAVIEDGDVRVVMAPRARAVA